MTHASDAEVTLVDEVQRKGGDNQSLRRARLDCTGDNLWGGTSLGVRFLS